MAGTSKVVTREEGAQRLLNGSVRRSYEPAIDVDWDAPLEPGRYYLPPKLITLYDTPLWRGMSEERRIELSRQELANVMSVGIWFENVLNQMLLRMAYDADPTSKYVHYALTEMGDECRHMIMFGRLIDRVGGRAYRRGSLWHNVGRVFPLALRGSGVWVAALMGEEIFDALQRETMRDPELQPLVHQVMRIHVAEEARHIKYAREDLVRSLRTAGRFEKEATRIVAAQAGMILTTSLTNAAVYQRAGLNPDVARRQARANPHARTVVYEGFEKLRTFLYDNDLIGGPSVAIWRRCGLVK
jgi:hypothetical protein